MGNSKVLRETGGEVPPVYSPLDKISSVMNHIVQISSKNQLTSRDAVRTEWDSNPWYAHHVHQFSRLVP